MFHDMSFLKQPRREPHKPPSRRRESEVKRGEREREDIAAFFLHKTLPDNHDVQGRKQPDDSGLFRHDDRICDDLFNTPGRRHAHNQPGLLPEMDQRHAPIHESTGRAEKGQSKPSTCISRSTSLQSTGLRDSSMGNARTLSSTPVRIREALARSGIFENTGIPSGNSHGHQGQRFHSQEELASARSSSMSQSIGKNAQQGLGRNVRIVLYQDRGTMADEKMVGPEDDASHRPMQTPPAVSQAEPLDTARPAQSVNMFCSSLPVGEVSTDPCKTTDTSTNLHDTQMCNQALGPDEGSLSFQAVPERPSSPKCAVVERLEAAAENMRPLCSPPATSATTLIDRQPSWSLAGNTMHCPSKAEVVPTTSIPCVPSVGNDAHRVLQGPVLSPFQRDRVLLKPSLSVCLTQARPVTDGTSTPHAISQTQFPVVNHYLDQTSSILPVRVRSKSMTDHTASMQYNHSHRDYQSVQDYIAEIERHILDQTDVDEGSEVSSSKEINLTSNSDLAELDADVEHANAYLQSHVRPNGPYLNQAANSASPHNWTAVAELEEDEEQRFMSSFWRPSGHPI